jgi:hypothetical protein
MRKEFITWEQYSAVFIESLNEKVNTRDYRSLGTYITQLEDLI